ncbi:hypothetical protein AB0K15_37690 [Amycolatopsis sp. NPDC049253]|uniref:hypothetical protein n=1 Tax=Amycolatopsis sp. NPDC049253 TaxID=3155274 RepID=UPI003428A612
MRTANDEASRAVSRSYIDTGGSEESVGEAKQLRDTLGAPELGLPAGCSTGSRT